MASIRAREQPGASSTRPAAGPSPATARSGRPVGFAIGLASAACFGTSGTLGSALIGAGWSPGGAVLVRAAVAALALTIPALIALRGRWPLLRRSAGRVLAYGLVGVAACQVCYFHAIALMPVGVALLLEYLGVVLIVGWLWLRHGQRPTRLTVIGGVAALGGLALMLNLSGAGGISLAGVAWALLAAVAMAVYFIQSAADTTDTLPPVVLTWGGMVTGAAALAIGGATGLVPLRASMSDVNLIGHQVSVLVPVLGLSLVAAAAAYVLGIGAARRLGAKLGSFVAMAEIGFAVTFAWVLLHQTPTATQFLGGGLILAGVIAVRLDEP
jgi:drug/metabolite transporter (DMT)-like permease